METEDQESRELCLGSRKKRVYQDAWSAQMCTILLGV